MDDTFRAVTSAAITRHIGITLVRNEYGWHFHGWHDIAGRQITDPPLDSADYAKPFETADAGITYFRERYTERLRCLGY